MKRNKNKFYVLAKINIQNYARLKNIWSYTNKKKIYAIYRPLGVRDGKNSVLK